MSGIAVRYLSALLPRVPTDHSTSREDEVDCKNDFLMLDKDVSISRQKIEIGTVLYDRRSRPTRASSWMTRMFSFIKRLQAVSWVSTFVGTRLQHLPGSKEFVSRINKNWGVRREEFIDFLLEQRLTGISAQALGSGAHNSFGEYQVGDVGGSITGRLSSAFGNSMSVEQINAFLAFIDTGCLDVPQHGRAHAEEFVSRFRSFASAHQDHLLLPVMQGKVNLLARRLQEDQKFFDDCRAFEKKLAELPTKVTSSQRQIDGWSDFKAAIQAGARGRTEYHKQTNGLHTLEYADSFLDMVENNHPITQGGHWPDASWRSLVETVYFRYNCRETRNDLAPYLMVIGKALARRVRSRDTPADRATRKALEAFFAYCYRGPAAISRHSIGLLKDVTEESVRSFCHETFGKDGEGKDIATWADNLFLRLQADLETFEGPVP